MLKQVLIVTSLCTIVGCASTEQGEPEDPLAAESSRPDCISQASIRDYTVLDDSNLIVMEGANRKYHVELTRRAHGLRSSRAIAFDSQTGRICGKFDDLVVNSGLGPEKIRIASVRRITAESEEELLIRFGKIEPEFEQPRQPETVEGAEVEELD